MKKSFLLIFIISVLSLTTLYSQHHNHKHMKVADPVCNRIIESSHTKYKTFHNGEQFWFCSKTCFKSFLKSPVIYKTVAKARTLSKAGKNDEAIKLVSDTLAGNGINKNAAGEYNFTLGYLYSRKGTASETVKYWEKVLNEYPVKNKESFIRINCAIIYLKNLNNAEKAVTLIETGLSSRVINTLPHKKTALNTLLAAYKKLGKKDKVRETENRLKKVK